MQEYDNGTIPSVYRLRIKNIFKRGFRIRYVQNMPVAIGKYNERFRNYCRFRGCANGIGVCHVRSKTIPPNASVRVFSEYVSKRVKRSRFLSIRTNVCSLSTDSRGNNSFYNPDPGFAGGSVFRTVVQRACRYGPRWRRRLWGSLSRTADFRRTTMTGQKRRVEHTRTIRIVRPPIMSSSRPRPFFGGRFSCRVRVREQ